MRQKKTKIAVLGGGMSSLAAIFELTNPPDSRDQYDITVYQLGWRLGGKGASGRNLAQAERIEEHGLHVWFGFYDNAFRLIKACYDELDRSPDAPLATWQDALKPHNFEVLSEHYNGRWVPWNLTFPPNSSEPGTGGVLPTFLDMTEMMLGWLWEMIKALKQQHASISFGLDAAHDQPHWWSDMLATIDRDLESVALGISPLFEMALKLARLEQAHHRRHHFDWICHLLAAFKAHVWQWVEPRIDDDEVRFFWVMMDLATAVICGFIQDDLLTQGLDSIDDVDFAEWLQRSGANNTPPIIDRPPVRAIYDTAFCYLDGDVNKPNMAAGVGLRSFLRIALTYKGALLYKMQAGMGDTIFTPLYEVLKRRGVTFKFFHSVTELGLSDDQSEVATISIQPQVNLTVGEYNPLVLVKDLACWPSTPLYEQIDPAQAAVLQEKGIDLEHTHVPFPEIPQKTLHLGQDFDQVILGISLAALPSLCGELMAAHQPFADMVNKVGTVMTQAFQLWMNRDLDQLGWGSRPSPILGTYVEPLDTYADMPQLIAPENWREADNVRSIAYFCGVLADQPDDSQAKADARAKAAALGFVQHDTAYLWPASMAAGSDQFDWSLLVDRKDRQGAARFDAQYWRGNFQASERYVASFVGQTQYRLRADQSGFSNLYLAGDWTLNGFNAGCIEACTMSGMQVSRAMAGYPQHIVGEDDAWLNSTPDH